MGGPGASPWGGGILASDFEDGIVSCSTASVHQQSALIRISVILWAAEAAILGEALRNTNCTHTRSFRVLRFCALSECAHTRVHWQRLRGGTRGRELHPAPTALTQILGLRPDMVARYRVADSETGPRDERHYPCVRR